MDDVIVVGAGTMGAGIAAVAAAAGFAVDLVEPDAGARARAAEKLRGLTVRLHDSIPASSAAVAAIEAVSERAELKISVLASLALAIPPRALLATNTSSLCIGDLVCSIAHPERVLGLHFFNPPEKMALVEIVRAEKTSDEAVARARAMAQRFGKTAVETADTPGFIVNRVARPYYLQSMRAYDAGAAPIEELDRLARGAGFRMGPFELMDLIGLDVNLATSESIYERTGAARLQPVQLQRDLVSQGRLGRKSGAGFYDYADGPPRFDLRAPPEREEVDRVERIAIVGFGGIALELEELLSQRYADVRLQQNEDLFDELAAMTVVIDTGDGVTDRNETVRQLDSVLAEEAVIFVDAYATDLQALARSLRHPQRVVGYGVLGALGGQRVVEIVDAEATSDDALELAQDLFESIGKGAALVADVPGLFLGRTVGSIVNEAVHAVADEVAGADDIDVAMRLGTNYPIGPLAWGREIGGDRLTRILHRLAAAEGTAFAPHRALWLLDAEQEPQEEQGEFDNRAYPSLQ